MEEQTIIWTCVVIFIATALVTLLGILDKPKLIHIDDKWLKPLFGALLLEIVAVCIYVFQARFATVEPQPDMVAASTLQEVSRNLDEAMAAREKANNLLMVEKQQIEAAEQKINQMQATVRVLQTKLSTVKSEAYHTGRYNKEFGTHFTCSERGQNLPARVCGSNYTPLTPERLKIHSGDTCGYEYFIVTCIQNI